jgi:hypothetical protein
MPQSRRLFASIVAISVLSGGLLSAEAAEGQDFHVSNKIYFPEAKVPETSTTLFHAGRVYDFVETTGGATLETIVFDKTNDLIIILDPNRKMRTEITTGQVATQIGRLHEAAKQHSNKESVRFQATPQFSERVDSKTGELTLDNKWMRYVVETEAPKNPFAAKQYNEFADWFAQTNALLNPPWLPFPRLKLNEVLKKRQEIPLHIELTMKPEGRGKPYTIRSEHNVTWTLSTRDKQRIDDVNVQLHTFNLVSFDEYHRVPENEQARK